MKISKNKVVGIEYELFDAITKELLDTNKGKESLEYIVAKGHIIKGLDDGLLGLEKDDKIDIKIDPKDAYGQYDDKAIDSVPKEQFADIELTEGMTLYGTGEHGQTTQVVVKEIKQDEIIVDFNHPMAGKTLMFSVSIASIREATADEIASATVGGSAGGCGCGNNDGGCGESKHEHKHDTGSCCSS